MPSAGSMLRHGERHPGIGDEPWLESETDDRGFGFWNPVGRGYRLRWNRKSPDQPGSRFGLRAGDALKSILRDGWKTGGKSDFPPRGEAIEPSDRIASSEAVKSRPLRSRTGGGRPHSRTPLFAPNFSSTRDGAERSPSR